MDSIPVNEDAVEKSVVRLHPIRVYGCEVITPGRNKQNVIVAVINGKVVSFDMPTTQVREWMSKQILEAIGDEPKGEDGNGEKAETKPTETKTTEAPASV